MKFTSYFILLILCLFVSCKQDTASIKLLTEAQKTVDKNPSEALALLDSIPDPNSLGQEYYMQYIVAWTAAKLKLQQDIAATGDTLIFEAQKYFNGTNNAKQAMLANYYAGVLNREMKRYDQSLEGFLRSADYAREIGDSRLLGKSFDNMGYIYLEQCIMDSAIINYKKAINYYTLENDSASIMKATNQIGRAYEDKNMLDSAYFYFNRVLQIAEKLDDEQYKSRITQNLGLVTYNMGEYEKAIGYYQSILNMEATSEEQRKRADLSLLKIYNLQQNSSLAKEYALKVETDLPHVTDIYTQREMYAALSNYYKSTGDYKQALHFKELYAEIIQQISEEERPAEMIKVDTNFRIEQKNRHYEELQYDFYIYLIIGTAAIIIAIVFFVITFKQNKKDRIDIQFQTEKYNRLREKLASMRGDYSQSEAQIKAILEDDDKIDE